MKRYLAIFSLILIFAFAGCLKKEDAKAGGAGVPAAQTKGDDGSVNPDESKGPGETEAKGGTGEKVLEIRISIDKYTSQKKISFKSDYEPIGKLGIDTLLKSNSLTVKSGQIDESKRFQAGYDAQMPSLIGAKIDIQVENLNLADSSSMLSIAPANFAPFNLELSAIDLAPQDIGNVMIEKITLGQDAGKVKLTHLDAYKGKTIKGVLIYGEEKKEKDLSIVVDDNGESEIDFSSIKNLAGKSELILSSSAKMDWNVVEGITIPVTVIFRNHIEVSVAQ